MTQHEVAIIDDEAMILKSLGRLIRQLGPQWSVRLFDSPEMALQHIQQGTLKPDLIICDRIMPGIQGDDLLKECMHHHPTAVRLLLTADSFADVTAIVSSHIHLFMGKPFERQDIDDVLTRVMTLKELPLDEESRQALGQLDGIPVLDVTYQNLSRLLKYGDPSMDDVAMVVRQDPGIVTRVLQVANSPFMGFSGKVSSIFEAVKRVGVNMVESMVLASSLSHAFSLNTPPHKGIIERALTAAFIARRLTILRQFPRQHAEYAFSLSLLSCVGELYEASFPEALPTMPVSPSVIPSSALISLYLLTLWGLDGRLIEGLRYAFTEPDAGDDQVKIFFMARRLACEHFDVAIEALSEEHQDTLWAEPLDKFKVEPVTNVSWEGE